MTSRKMDAPLLHLAPALLLSTPLSFFVACAPAERDEDATAPPVVEVTALDYAFQAPAAVPSGWVTLELQNAGQEEHFLVLWKLPEGRTIDDYRDEVASAFGQAYAALVEGGSKEEAGALLGRLLPEWYASVQPAGGPGFVSPGRTARTTVELEPGAYVMECYVKTPDGRFHIELGMARALTVSDEPTSASPVGEADVTIVLSNEGIATEGELGTGERRIAVEFHEHPAAGLGNDVHLVRLGEQTDLAAVMRWMDWMNLDGIRAPAPAEFLGGAHEMPVGNTAYLTVTLEPGRYAWVTETAADRGMAREFLVR